MTPEHTSARADFLLPRLEAPECRDDRCGGLFALRRRGRDGGGRAARRLVDARSWFWTARLYWVLLAWCGAPLFDHPGPSGGGRDLHAERTAHQRAFFHTQAGGRYVTRDLGGAFEHDGFGPNQVALNGSPDRNARAVHVAANARLFADRYVAGDVDVALDAAINFNGALATDVAANDGARTNNGTFGHLLLYEF